MSDLDKEAREASSERYSVEVPGKSILAASFEIGYIAGHQSAERKSAAKDEKVTAAIEDVERLAEARGKRIAELELERDGAIGKSKYLIKENSRLNRVLGMDGRRKNHGEGRGGFSAIRHMGDRIEELEQELRKTREMVRGLVGALEIYADTNFYALSGSLRGKRECARVKGWGDGLGDMESFTVKNIAGHTDEGETLEFTYPGKAARAALQKYKTEIDQLWREQNGASSTKLMGGME